MKILCVCDEGNNRSVHIAHLLRYKGHDTLAVGVNHASEQTKEMLAEWADLVIFTGTLQKTEFPVVREERVWPIPDIYPRPFNPSQDHLVRALIERSGL